MLDTPATQQLIFKGIPFRTFQHTGSVSSLEQAALERSQKPGQVIRSILFRLSKANYVMVLIAGAQQVSWKVLRTYLGTSRISMASEGEVLQITGYPIGAVSPFGLLIPVRILADESIWLPDEVSIGSGKRGNAIILTRPALVQALPVIETGCFCEQEE